MTKFFLLSFAVGSGNDIAVEEEDRYAAIVVVSAAAISQPLFESVDDLIIRMLDNSAEIAAFFQQLDQEIFSSHSFWHS